MKLFVMLASCLSVLFSCSLAYPKTLEHNKERLVEIIGPITGEALAHVAKIDELSRKSSDDIHLFINSPGGGVIVGMFIIDAMTAAKSRGVKFVCSTGMLAASMAFSILAHCDERYSLRNAKLLFHPVRAILGGGFMSPGEAVTPAKAKDLAEDLEREDSQLKSFVRSCLPKVSDEWFDHHYARETLWTAETLAKEPGMKGWLTIVDDISGVSSPFNIGAQ